MTLMQQIVDAVDDAFDDQVAFTQALVAEPTLMGHEAKGQQMMAEAMTSRGLDVDHWKIHPSDLENMIGFGRPVVSYDNAYNVVGIHRPGGSGRSLIVNGHIDVVPPGPEEHWTTPPFEPRIEDGWLYGRGSADMKAGLVAALFAWDALRAAGAELTGDLILQSVIEEESTGNGTLACVQRGYTADAALFPEPTFTGYVSAQVGLLWFRVHVAGRPAHSSVASTGANAIQKAYYVFEKLKALEHRWNERKAEFGAFADVEDPINLQLGQISGGEWPSSVPSWCTIDVRVGLYPGVTAEEVRHEVEGCIASAAAEDPFLSEHPPRVEWTGHFGAGYELKGGDEIISTLATVHEQVFGKPLVGFPSTGSSDARVLGAHGIPSILYGPISRNTHAFDEAVRLDSVRKITKSLALFIASWCGSDG